MDVRFTAVMQVSWRHDASPQDTRPSLAPIFKGREVSARVTKEVVAVCRKRGICVVPLLKGLGFDESLLCDPSARHSWDDFVLFLERVQAAVGGPWEMERVGFDTIQTNRAFRLLGRLILSPRQLYLYGMERISRTHYSCIGSRVEPLAGGRLRCTSMISPDYVDSLAYHYATIGALRAYPRLLGRPAAIVETEMMPHKGVHIVTLPPGRQAKQAERTASNFLSALFAGPSFPGPLAGDEVARSLAISFDYSSLLETVQALGQQLTAAANLTQLGHLVVAIMQQYFCATHVVLAVTAGQDRFEIVRQQEAESAPSSRCSRVIREGGLVVGRLEADASITEDGSASPLFDALLPWLASALARCSRSPFAAGPVDVNATLVRTAPTDWHLTDRQAQVLALLAQGKTNKQIARELDVATRTVEVHVSELLKRAGTANRTELLARLHATGAA